jgi:hypothetical protein
MPPFGTSGGIDNGTADVRRTVGGDLDHVPVDIRTTRPGTPPGSAEIDRLRDELEELTGKPVLLNTLEDRPHPQESR